MKKPEKKVGDQKCATRLFLSTKQSTLPYHLSYYLSGCATVTIGEKVEDLFSNQSTFVPKGTLHRLANNHTEPLIIIEIQIGSYLGRMTLNE